ncbi:M4 family metallopeptidase [Oleiagrimonas sp. MCCC 1A03011]|uniref:M4 family metallopeptidase n=1 Tax=Oleiagrimonas sp. MCCC 1A03011 TaxID=1926883 RepID=UPI000DD7A512|nr:M4 family metallopeptidase [Oleiagrimonas sp. MCCC 1A03011]
MPGTFRLNILVAAMGLAAFSTANAATTEHLHARTLGVTPASQLAHTLGLGNGMSFKARFSRPTRHGTDTVRMQQMYNGVPVYGRSIAVEQNAQGQALVANGPVAQSFNLSASDMRAKLTGDRAVEVLRGRHNPFMAPGQSIHNAKADLYVYPESQGQARLVYLTSYFAAGNQPARPTAIIDANTGEIIEQWDGLTTADGYGPGGNQKTGQYQYGTDYPALVVTASGSTCSLSNSDVKTYDMNNAMSGSGTLVSFPCYTHTGDGVNGAYSPENDAHHFGQVVHDMYNNWFGAPPLNFTLVMKVHLGSNYENAYWDGSAMNFGDGASTFYPLTSLDVTSHEISHGFTEQHSNLQYSGQSGGMNEAFSDMAGEAAEYYDRGSNDWLVGAEIIKSGTALRYMCNPTQDGSSIDNAADYYSGLNVHYSSGVYNKAFCTLAKTSGWNTKKAFEVFERANALYWSSTATFNSGACGVESASDDLGYTTSDVVSAFNAVGVSCPSGGGGGGGGGTGGSLQNGTAVSLSGSSGAFSSTYTVQVPSGSSNLVISTSGGSGDADLYVKLGSEPTLSSYDCRPYKNGNSESCSFSSPSTSTYYVKLYGYSSYSGVSLKATWTEPSGGGGGGGGFYENSTNVNIPDQSTASSYISVSGEANPGPSDLQVHVKIVHTYRGDLRITLYEPNGSSVVLKSPSGSDGTDNVDQTYTVNASSVDPNGQWRLKVDDVYAGDTGYIDDWSLQF